ncbi:MAG: hypothetical protein AVDCRST_MAG23-1617, partial [uncultured Sphingosinicella sp.]
WARRKRSSKSPKPEARPKLTRPIWPVCHSPPSFARSPQWPISSSSIRSSATSSRPACSRPLRRSRRMKAFAAPPAPPATRQRTLPKAPRARRAAPRLQSRPRRERWASACSTRSRTSPGQRAAARAASRPSRRTAANNGLPS